MTIEPSGPLNPTIALELDDGAVFRIHSCREDVAREIVRRWNAGTMTEARAREILGDHVTDDGGLGNDCDGIGCYLKWRGKGNVVIDGEASAEQLEAIAWWMRNATATPASPLPESPSAPT